MHCKDLEFVLESQGLGTLSTEARDHLAECSSCQALLADFHSIVAVAQTLPAEVEPPDRIWISLRSQLEAEGVIKETVESVAGAPWWESLGMLFRPRTLATAAAGLLLVVGMVYFTHKPASIGEPVANTQPAVQPPQSQQASVPVPAPITSASPAPAVAEVAHAPAAKSPKAKDLASSPSENLSSPLAPAGHSDMLAGDMSVDASFRDNLRTLNQFIAECQRHLKQNPQDEMAREYLNMAYQQKADLLAAMMDNGRSEH